MQLDDQCVARAIRLKSEHASNDCIVVFDYSNQLDPAPVHLSSKENYAVHLPTMTIANFRMSD
jgi:hypothetical protein